LKRLVLGAVLAAVAAAGAAPAFAELVLEGAGWQAGQPQRPPRPVLWADAENAALPKKGPSRLRAKALLKNRGPKSVEGILLRYVVSARLITARTDVAAEAAWALPFSVAERRVPKIGPNQVLEVPLTVTPALEDYLKRIKRQGMRANGLKVQVQIETHADGAVMIKEAVLAVQP
jgi:hypothetical protein